MPKNSNVKDWKEKECVLAKEMEEWEKNWKHRQPCERYKRTGFCNHLLKAQNRKFSNRTKSLLFELTELLSHQSPQR